MKPPNILHIFCDQFRADCLGILGHPVLHTPHLDRLCSEGTVFTNAFSPSPVCAPARASMTFGRYPAQTECYDNEYPPIQGDDDSFVEDLRRSGYRTHGIGKCHFTPDLYAMRGFDSRETSEELFPDPHLDDYASWLHKEGFGHLAEIHGVRGEMYYIPQIAQMPASHHPSQWIGDRTCDFIRKHESEQPWYLFSSYIHPHPPFAPPTPWHKLYRAMDMPLPNVPPSYEELQLFVNRVQNRYKYRDRGFDLNLVRCIRAAYYSCISFIDFQIGRALDTLESIGQLDNTLIVFSADHGELLGDYQSFGKRSMHDASSRIPMVARHPKFFPRNSYCETAVSLIDLAPTFLEAAQINPSNSLPGTSLQKTQSGETDREIVFSQYEQGEKAIYMAVSRNWKFIYSAPDQKEFLFDRKTDPQETRNVAGLPDFDPTTTLFRDTLQEFLDENSEDSNLDSSAPNKWKARYPLTMTADPDEGLLVQDPTWADFTIPNYSDSKPD